VCVFDGCGKSFNREGKLADHMRTHTGEVLLIPPQYLNLSHALKLTCAVAGAAHSDRTCAALMAATSGSRAAIT
jgi:hypothetical protein